MNRSLHLLGTSTEQVKTDPTEYIKITYMFQIPSSDEDETCVPIERNYIWSTSPVFLLGPKALFWLSLFSISVNEESVAIRLATLYTGDCSKRSAHKINISGR